MSVWSFFWDGVRGVLGQQGPLEVVEAAAAAVEVPNLLALFQVEVRGEQLDGSLLAVAAVGEEPRARAPDSH
jgi:hypothetical protein